MSRGILIAQPTTLGQCRVCRQAVPLAQLSRIGCAQCWGQAGAERGFTLRPPGFALVREVDAVLLALLMKLLETHVGERGGNEDAVKCLARLIIERGQLAKFPTLAGGVYCCYCGESGPDEQGNGGVALESLDFAEHLPDLWRCSDDQMCLRRLLARLQPAEAPQREGVA